MSKKKPNAVDRKLISAEPDFWKQMDDNWKSKNYESRSAYIRHAVEQLEKTIPVPPVETVSFL